MNSTGKTRSSAERARRMAYLRGKLLEKRRALMENVEAQINEVQEPAGMPGDTADMASSMIAQEDTYRVGAVGSDAVAQIDYALQRLESGKYGICEDCGRRIPEARLRAVPFAYLCVECKQHEEEDARRRGDEPGAAVDEMADVLGGEGEEESAGSEIVRGRRPSD